MSNPIKTIDQENAVFETQKDLKALKRLYEVKRVAYNDLKRLIDQETEDHESNLKALKNELVGLKADAKDLKAQVKSNKELLKTQNTQIDEAVKNGNDHILNLQYEANNLESLRTNLEYEVATLTRSRDQLFQEVQSYTAQKAQLDDKYNQQNKLYQATLNGLRDRILIANQELKETQTEARTIIERLSKKEFELSSTKVL